MRRKIGMSLNSIPDACQDVTDPRHTGQVDSPDAMIRIPTPLRWLFQDFRSAPLWLLVRLTVGGLWFVHGFPKLSDSKWVGADAGSGVLDFVNRALERSTGPHPEVLPITALFLGGFMQPLAHDLAPFFAYGEVLLGLLLMLGVFTGVTSFAIACLSFLFILAGEGGLNPINFLVSGLLVVAWRIAGWWGLDRWILPRWLSTCWNIWNLD